MHSFVLSHQLVFPIRPQYTPSFPDFQVAPRPCNGIALHFLKKFDNFLTNFTQETLYTCRFSWYSIC